MRVDLDPAVEGEILAETCEHCHTAWSRHHVVEHLGDVSLEMTLVGAAKCAHIALEAETAIEVIESLHAQFRRRAKARTSRHMRSILRSSMPIGLLTGPVLVNRIIFGGNQTVGMTMVGMTVAMPILGVTIIVCTAAGRMAGVHPRPIVRSMRYAGPV